MAIDIRHGLVRKPTVPAKDVQSGRDILQGSTDRESLVKQAKDHAQQFEDGLKSATRGIAGARFDAVRSEKNPKRIDEKIEKEGQPIHTIPDILAGRISVDTPEAHERTAASIKKHFKVIRDIDEFEKGAPDTGYRAHKLQVQVTPELSAETHILPKEVLEANRQEHHVYKASRDAEIDGDDKAADKKAAQAKKINDIAMSAFNSRNGVGQQSNSETKGGRGESPEQVGAVSRRAAAPALSTTSATSNDVPKPEIKTGSTVRMKDGTRAKVAYAPAAGKIPMYRLKTEEGKIHHVHGRDIGGVTALPDEWVGVDLDKTLAHFTVWKGETSIGKPLPEMVERVKKMLKDGDDVRIFTARIANDPTGAAKKAIEQWCVKNIGMKLPITNKKDNHMKVLYDDRARQVEANTGKVIAPDFKAGLKRRA